MTPGKHSLIIAIFSICIHQTKSQLIVCAGPPGSTCFCPSASDPSVTPGEICVLDCGRPDMCQEHTLTCRPNDPCYINCAGKASCSEMTIIDANGATDLTVRCANEDSCKSDIHITCGTGDCLLECVRFGSCLEFGWVDTRTAKAWDCHGLWCPWTLLPLRYSMSPTGSPTPAPTTFPTPAPTSTPTFQPSRAPTDIPTTMAPSYSPTKTPTHPTATPTISPTYDPTGHPTIDPTKDPTYIPTVNPTLQPSLSPTIDPTHDPTNDPTQDPTNDPTIDPTRDPTKDPTSNPTEQPTTDPTIQPTLSPTDPTENPSFSPTNEPTIFPSGAPSAVEEAKAAEFLASTGWTVLISVLSITVFCFILILIIVLFWRKYKRDKLTDRRMMSQITTPETQNNISPDTHDTDAQVLDGLETTDKIASVSELDLNILHSLNAWNNQDKKRMKATNAGQEDGEDFQIDPNLVSAFMFGGDTDGFGETAESNSNNPFLSLGITPGGGNNGNNSNNPFDDGMEMGMEEEPNQLQQADSVDDMSVIQQRMRLMQLLQQQYELMNDYNMAPQNQRQQQEKDNLDVNVDMEYPY